MTNQGICDVSAVLLAAGESTRFGSPKTLALVDGETMLDRSRGVLVESRLAPVVIVVAPDTPLASNASLQPPARIVVNDKAHLGIGTSIAVGVSALPDATQAVVIALADQPGLRPELVLDLVHAWRNGLGKIVRPVYRGRPCHPVVFDKIYFPKLAVLDGDGGGSTVIARHTAEVHVIEVTDEHLVDDVDQPDDLQAFVDGHSG